MNHSIVTEMRHSMEMHNTLSYTAWKCKYHVVFISKYGKSECAVAIADFGTGLFMALAIVSAIISAGRFLNTNGIVIGLEYSQKDVVFKVKKKWSAFCSIFGSSIDKMKMVDSFFSKSD